MHLIHGVFDPNKIHFKYLQSREKKFGKSLENMRKSELGSGFGQKSAPSSMDYRGKISLGTPETATPSPLADHTDQKVICCTSMMDDQDWDLVIGRERWAIEMDRI